MSAAFLVMCKSHCLPQIRPLNCGRCVKETRGQRDTTWKMRRDGSRTSLPSPLCRCTHPHSNMRYSTLCVVKYKMNLPSNVLPSCPDSLPWINVKTSFFPRCQCWNPQIWWLRFDPDEFSPMDTPIMSTPSLSTAMEKPTYLLMTSVLICGTLTSQIAASVSFYTQICLVCVLKFQF